MCCSNHISEEDLQPGKQDNSFLPLIAGMRFFDPHVHMTSRTTDDYEAMADAGVVDVRVDRAGGHAGGVERGQ